MNGSGTSATVLLMESLLPPLWPGRRAALEAAGRLDARHGGNASGLLIDAWRTWRCTGRLPRVGPTRDLVAVLAELLEGVGHELRRTPRGEANDTPHGERCPNGTCFRVDHLGGDDG